MKPGDTASCYVVIDGVVYTARIQKTGELNGGTMIRLSEPLVVAAKTKVHEHRQHSVAPVDDGKTSNDPLLRKGKHG